jgi:hypothetical protein
MNSHPSPLEFYRRRIDELSNKLGYLYKKRTLIGWLRLLVLIATALAVYYSWNADNIIIILIATVGLCVFFYIVSKDIDNKEEIENLETIVTVNKMELHYAEGNFDDAYDGTDLEPAHHSYAADLDLFGKSSLYQFINRCNSEKAKLILAQRLLNPLTESEILKQQDAARELSAKPLWRQQLQAYGIKQIITLETEKKVLQWITTNENYFKHPFFKVLLYVFPVITIGSIYLCLADYISFSTFLALLVVFIAVSGSLSKKITPVYNLLSKIVSEINVLYNEMNWFEKESFHDDLLIELQQKIKSDSTHKGSGEILHLRKILSRFDTRLNVLAFIILNTLFLWDVWQLMALKKWKARNQSIVPHWFETIASLEVSNTLATLLFNHPDWCFPVISGQHFTLEGQAIGHPLIPEKQRVNNSFQVCGTGKIDLITGSNMAGKSTFLRSIGVNMILAYAGAPVCAKQFTVSIVTVKSSMRVADNLAENTSTFYAELKKLKSIIEVVNNHEKVLIILDEILRGTNSFDRHTGSSALIKQLIKKNAVALIATHDVELAELEKDFPGNISNYHFDVQVSGEELYFDYKLKRGICTSLNASLLMKKIGIELG